MGTGWFVKLFRWDLAARREQEAIVAETQTIGLARALEKHDLVNPAPKPLLLRKTGKPVNASPFDRGGRLDPNRPGRRQAERNIARGY